MFSTLERWIRGGAIDRNSAVTLNEVSAGQEGVTGAGEERDVSPSLDHIWKLVDAVSHIVWSATAGGSLEYGNASWFRLVGGAIGEDVDLALGARLSAADHDRRSEEWLRALRLGESYEVEYRLESERTGRPRWYLERGTPVREPPGAALTGWVVIATPIDRSKRAEMELRSTLNGRDDFLAVLLHELRNPLAPIASALELLDRGGNDAGIVRTARATIRRQLQQITRLVDDLLDVSRASRGRLELHARSIELDEALEIAVESARTAIDLRRQCLTRTRMPQPIHLIADPVRLGQVLTNLLINASKYTQPGGHISVTAGQEKAAVWISVRDDGIGIAEEKIRELFQPFTQAEPLSAASGGGLGIGLALCRQLVELHGGTITAHSEGVGKGTEFVVRLPSGNQATQV